MMRLHRASNGKPVVLGRELGRGGEGVVSEVNDAPELVAKVYFRPADSTKARKLQVLARHSTPQLQDAGAWPIDVLLDASGATHGVLMPKLGAFGELHELYTPKSRRKEFPDADFRFIVQVAESLARAVALVHSLGHVIGDLNHGNAVVDSDGRVRLIDCDSFQVRDAESLYTCDVGVALFTPPELQGRVLRGLERSADHDAFGLAVLVFHLLFLGRHPFAGRITAGDMTIERAITDGRFAYGAKLAAELQPPGTLELNVFGAGVAQLFERAFDYFSIGKRPAAQEWASALAELQAALVACRQFDAHYHPRQRDCCWCEIETRTLRAWFGDPLQFAQSPVDLELVERLWREVHTVAPPPGKPPVPAHYFLAEAWAEEKKNRQAGRSLFAFVYIIGWMWVGVKWVHEFVPYTIWGFLLGVVFYFMLLSRERDIDPEIEIMNARWLENRVANISSQPYGSALAELTRVRKRLLAIRMRPEAAMPEIIELHTAYERQRYLATLPVSGAYLREADQDDRRRLTEMGVLTAADVLARRSELHHSVSYAVVRDLLNWAGSREAEFMLDPAAPMPTDPDWVAQRLQEVVEDLIGQLAEGPEVLRERVRRFQNSQDALYTRARETMFARKMP